MIRSWFLSCMPWTAIGCNTCNFLWGANPFAQKYKFVESGEPPPLNEYLCYVGLWSSVQRDAVDECQSHTCTLGWWACALSVSLIPVSGSSSALPRVTTFPDSLSSLWLSVHHPTPPPVPLRHSHCPPAISTSFSMWQPRMLIVPTSSPIGCTLWETPTRARPTLWYGDLGL